MQEKILKVIQNEVASCTKCKLHSTRKNTVFGSGNPGAELMLVGEGPGSEEDESGLPFVGRAGKLLDNMIKSINFNREDVFIANVVKCRPPNNRKPDQDESEACLDYLRMQIHIIAPVCIIALGATATEALLGPGPGILKRRGQMYQYEYETAHGKDTVPVYPTLHPAALLRNPKWKDLAWEDFQLVRKHMDSWDIFVGRKTDPEALEREARQKEALAEERKASRYARE